MKRILSLFLCMALSVTMITVTGITAVAQDTQSYEDYIPGDIPANLFICGAKGMYDTVNIGATGKDCKLGRNGYGYYITATSTATGEGEVGTCFMGNEGAYKLHGGYYTAPLFSETIKYGTNYVVSFMARKGETSTDTAINFGVYDYSQYKLLYTSEYGKEGLALTDSEWIPFEGTIHIPAGTSGVAPQFVIGLSETAPNGTSADARIVAEENYSTSKYVPEMYIAEEVAFDIENTLTSGDATVSLGDTLTFEAGLTNQLGLPGSLDQTFVWKAMDTTRQNEISGITVEPSDDTKSATVTIEGSVAPGSYDIVAYSEKYDMAKGCTITMEAPYYYEDNGDIVTEAKLNTSEEWTTEKVTTGLVNYIEVKASLTDNTESFEWFITDENRLSVVEDVFEVTPVTAEGAEQAVKIAAKTGVDIKAGNYNVIAVAKDGSLKAHPICLDISDDLSVILDTFTQGTAEEIEEGLNTSYLSVLGLLDSNSSKADKSALAKVISASAEEEKIDEITDLEDIKKVLERLAVLSFYNVKPEEVELVDENANFTYENELGIDKIDEDGVTLYALYKTAMTKGGQAKVLSDVTGKDFGTVSEFVSELKESIFINAIANPVSNGTGYVGNVLTKENMEAVSVDAGNYLESDMQSEYNGALAGKTLTLAQIEAELAEKYEQEEEEDTRPSGGSTGGGGRGGFSSSVSVQAKTPEKAEEEKTTEEIKFTDVAQTHWAFPEIIFLNKLGIVNGADDGKFYPEKTVTREEVLKMICIAFKVKSSDGDSSFDDVDKGAWYYNYVSSAQKAGIVNGINDKLFGIGQNVTRQDICVMIARALGENTDGYPEGMFTDVSDVSPYAANSVNYLSSMYVVNGFTDGSFRPLANCTRAEAVKIISNALHILTDMEN